MIDLHCHVLPGLDDGPATLDEALDLLGAQAAAGVRTVAATSHVSATYPGVTAERIGTALAEVRAAAVHAGIEVDVVAGAEVALMRATALDDAELRRLRLGDGPWLLLEPPHRVASATALEGAIGSLAERGHHLLLAHPERCPAFLQDPAAVGRLVERGVRCSVTASAFSGAFGRTVRGFALELLGAGLVHDLASDAHAGMASRPAGLREHLDGTGYEALADWLCEEAPAAFLRGVDLPPRPSVPPPPARGLGRLRRRR